MKAKNRMASENLSDRIEKVRCAIREKYRDPITGISGAYADDVFDDFAIVETDDGECYQIPYVVNGDVELDDPIEVEETYVPVTAREVADICATGRGWRLFVENKFSDPPEWIPLMPKPGEFNHPEYGKIKITQDRNRRFIQNFKDGVYQSRLPINAEHKPTEEGAYGWITEMRLNSDASVDGRTQWTDLGNTAIKNDRFQYISPEWFDSWAQKSTGKVHSDVLIGAALTVRPFFKEDSLRPLVASEAGLFAVDKSFPEGEGEGEVKVKRVFKDKDRIFVFTAFEPIQQEVVKMEPEKVEPKKGADVQEPEAKQLAETLKTENATLKTANETLGEQNKQLSERVGKLEKDAQRKRFTETAKAFNGATEKHVQQMEFIASHDEKGEASDLLKEYVETQIAVAEQLKAADLFTEVGHDAPGKQLTALDRINEEARKMREADPKLTTEQAVARVTEMNPKLYNEYRAEMQ